MAEPTKACKHCGVEKTFDEFPREAHSKDGVRSRCRECDRARRREYRKRNGEDVAAYQREYRKRNIERIREVRQRWEEVHPKVHVVHVQRRRALNRTLTEDDRLYESIVRRDPCAYCGAEVDGVDHIVPISRGGEAGWQNLTACCARCNARKHALPMLLFLQRQATDQGVRDVK